jgi:hypothetical protein
MSEIVNPRQLSTNQKCGNFQVAPWGSLLPVSSKQTGNIYKNINCAKEHNVKEEDIVVWEGAYYCRNQRILYPELNENYLNRCQKQFYPPNGIAIQTSSLCFNNLIDSCPMIDFPIPMYLDVRPSDVIDACTSGFVSPYRQKDMFVNIFCHICNGFMLKSKGECRNLLSLSSTIGKTGLDIFGLIDYRYLPSLSRDQGVGSDSTMAKMACLEKDTVFGKVYLVG